MMEGKLLTPGLKIRSKVEMLWKNVFSIQGLLIFFIVSCNPPEKMIKVACLGNSITEGSGLAYPDRDSYPGVLNRLLGKGYRVFNQGRSGATLLKQGDLPYWNTLEFKEVFSIQPDVIILKLGTNDSKTHNWNEESFLSDYQLLIDTLFTLKSKPVVFLCIPAPVFQDNWEIRDSVILSGVNPYIRLIAERNNLPLIDLREGLLNFPNFFPDGIHPSEDGASLIAGIVATAIRDRENEIQRSSFD